MRSWWNALIAVLLAGQIASQAAPGSESARKGVKLICGLAVLLTLLSPIRRLPEAAEKWRQAAEDYLAAREQTQEDPYETAAQAIMIYAADAVAYAADTVGGNGAALREPVELTITEGEDGEVREIRLFLPECPAETRSEIRETLEEAYGIPVFLYTRSGADDGEKRE